MQKCVFSICSIPNVFQVCQLWYSCHLCPFYVVYLFISALGLHCCVGFFLVVVSGALLFVLVQKLLFGEDSPVAEHGLQGRQASEAEAHGSAVAVPGLQGTGSAVVATRLICFASCGIFPDQGLNPCLLHWQADSLPLSQQGSLPFSFVQLIYHIPKDLDQSLSALIWFYQILHAFLSISIIHIFLLSFLFHKDSYLLFSSLCIIIFANKNSSIPFNAFDLLHSLIATYSQHGLLLIYLFNQFSVHRYLNYFQYLLSSRCFLPLTH